MHAQRSREQVDYKIHRKKNHKVGGKTMLSKAVIFLCILQAIESATWVQLTTNPLCIGAKDDKFKEIKDVGSSAFLGAIKLVHRSGKIACFLAGQSNWGCKGLAEDMRIMITDERNRRIYPAPRLVNTNRHGGYVLPGHSSTSAELVLADFGNPYYFKLGEKLRVWYSEDLLDLTEHDNYGSTCFDAYGYFLEDPKGSFVTT